MLVVFGLGLTITIVYHTNRHKTDKYAFKAVEIPKYCVTVGVTIGLTLASLYLI